MDKHINVVGILWIATGVIGILAAALVFFILLGVGIIAGLENATEALPILAIIGFIGGFIVFIVSVPSIIAGIGIVKHKQWGRILGLILAAINLLNVPIGTVLGAYTFWVLLNEESQKYFS